MSDLPTIFLVPYDKALARELENLLPSVQVGDLQLIAATAPPAWVFVDWLLPDISGLEFCRRLRAETATADVRIFLVIDDTDRETRRRALKAGADDYVVGPLSAAGIHARIREGAPLAARTNAILAHGALQLDREAFQVRAAGKPVPVSPNEFVLLSFFLENRDRVLSRRELIGALKGSSAVEERTVDVWIGRLRRALVAAKVPDPIRTVRQHGYVYDSY